MQIFVHLHSHHDLNFQNASYLYDSLLLSCPNSLLFSFIHFLNLKIKPFHTADTDHYYFYHAIFIRSSRCT